MMVLMPRSKTTAESPLREGGSILSVCWVSCVQEVSMYTNTRRKVRDEADADALLSAYAAWPDDFRAFCAAQGVDGRLSAGLTAPADA